MSIDSEPVRRFYTRARAIAGSEEKLAELCQQEAGRSYSRQAINKWIGGKADPPSTVTFAVARRLQLSLDEFLLPGQDRRSLQEQIADLRAIILEMRPAIMSGQATREGMTE